MIQPVNSLAWESEKIPWKTRRVVKDHLGHQGLPKAAKSVTQRSTQTSTLPQQSKKNTASVGRTHKLQRDAGAEQKSCSCPC